MLLKKKKMKNDRTDGNSVRLRLSGTYRWKTISKAFNTFPFFKKLKEANGDAHFLKFTILPLLVFFIFFLQCYTKEEDPLTTVSFVFKMIELSCLLVKTFEYFVTEISR